MKKLTTKSIRKYKIYEKKMPLSMLTCYDFQTAQLFNESPELDLILVGDSLGNVILGYDTTVEVSLEEMITFGAAVKRGTPDKFVIVDLPFGTYASLESGIQNAITLYQKTKCEAIKLEGAYPIHLELIERLTQNGMAVVGHIGLTPQSVHNLGGYYTHGKTEETAKKLIDEAIALEKAGCFCIVLECVYPELATKITNALTIPTIGIGSGKQTDGQVLVVNDLLHLGKHDPPAFCTPMANLYDIKKEIINEYHHKLKGSIHENHLHH